VFGAGRRDGPEVRGTDDLPQYMLAAVGRGHDGVRPYPVIPILIINR
jgi:hypothetical protein